ncbi:MAG: hypothetical protein K2N12_06655 [Helicobacter sp.]|nr:hypothetical protein [Helicobacter sp.]
MDRNKIEGINCMVYNITSKPPSKLK